MTRPLPPVEYGPLVEDDSDMGAFVYCRSHLRPHATGWCSVPTYMKVPLLSTTRSGAYEEVRSYGWRIFGEEA